MDVLNKKSGNIFLTLIFCFCSGNGFSAPPTDLTESTDPNHIQRPKALTEDDLVYTDNTAPLPDITKDMAVLNMAVVARSLPGRLGKPLFKLNPSDRVKILRKSKDSRWYAIESLKMRRKGWVPINSLVLPKESQPPESKQK